MAPQTIIDLFEEAVNRKSRPDALQVKREDGFHPLSSAEVRSQVQGVVAGLMNLGVEPGDRIALLSENRPEWLVSDIAILSAGAINVPIYPTLPATQIEGLLNNAGVRVIILSTQEQLEKIREIQSKVPSLQTTLVMDLEEAESDRLLSFNNLQVDGQRAWQRDPARYLKVRESIGPEDVATIIYTSGTTGPPKGVMLSHANIVANVLGLCRGFHFDQKDTALSFLPLSHIFERTADYLLFYCGVSIAYAESIEKVPLNMLEVRPTVVACVPRFFEKLHARVMESRKLSSGLKRMLTDWAFDVGGRHTRHVLEGTTPPPSLACQRFLASKIVFAKLQKRLGGRLRFFISGGAPLDPSLAEFLLQCRDSGPGGLRPHRNLPGDRGQSPEPLQVRNGGTGAARPGSAHCRRRRGSDPGTVGDARLLQEAGRNPRGAERGVAPHRGHRPSGLGGIPEDHRSQEGSDCHSRRKERCSPTDRETAQIQSGF